MNLHALLLEREAAGRPVTVGLIGAGKFGTMFLSQVRCTRGMHLVGLADLDVERARRQLRSAGWDDQAFAAASLGDARKTRRTHVTADADALIAFPDIEVIVEATGDPKTGIRLALATIKHGKHIVMVNVEADAVAGPLLARTAKAAGVVYSLAWGDQPALICEHVDWARACGFAVIAAGKGTRYHPSYHQSTPDTVWDILDKYLQITDRSSINPKMFNSFVDGTKSAIEMTAVCNATGLVPQSEGLGFPPATRFELAEVCKPRSAGGAIEKAGVTEVVSSVYRDGSDPPRFQRAIRGALPADPYDRSRARHLGRVGGAAQGADRRRDRLSLRRGGDRQARPQDGRDARRRGRLLRVGQADAGGVLARAGIFAARACPQHQAHARRCVGRAAQMVGR